MLGVNLAPAISMEQLVTFVVRCNIGHTAGTVWCTAQLAHGVQPDSSVARKEKDAQALIENCALLNTPGRHVASKVQDRCAKRNQHSPHGASRAPLQALQGIVG